MRGRSLVVAYVAVATVFSAQLVLAPALPSLARLLGLSEFQAGLFVTGSSAALMVSSPLWGRAVSRCGRQEHRHVVPGRHRDRPARFGIVAHLALADGSSACTFWLLLAWRALGQGVAAAATTVAVVAYLSQHTAAGAERVRALGLFGAALGLGTVLGPALGSFLASQSLLLVLYVPAAPVALVSIVVWRWMDSGRAEATPGDRETLRVRQVWPSLAIGFALFTVLAPVLVVDAFLLAALIVFIRLRAGSPRGPAPRGRPARAAS